MTPLLLQHNSRVEFGASEPLGKFVMGIKDKWRKLEI
jgi:hypothetical protein